MVGLLDFTLAPDQRRVGIHLDHLLGERAVGSGVGRRGEYDGQVEDFTQLSVRHDVLLVEGWVPVTGKLEEADLEIEDKKKLERSSVMIYKIDVW